jgi:hypothetical protein
MLLPLQLSDFGLQSRDLGELVLNQLFIANRNHHVSAQLGQLDLDNLSHANVIRRDMVGVDDVQKRRLPIDRLNPPHSTHFDFHVALPGLQNFEQLDQQRANGKADGDPMDEIFKLAVHACGAQ